jgi:hypothetical protein
MYTKYRMTCRKSLMWDSIREQVEVEDFIYELIKNG